MKKDNNLYILGKKILFEESPILYSFKATNLSEKNISEYFDIKKGQWTIEDGYLIGKNQVMKAALFILIKNLLVML